MDQTTLNFELSTNTQIITSKELQSLLDNITKNNDVHIIDKAKLSHTKGDSITLAHFAISITTALAPVISEIVYDWWKTNFNSDIDITVTKGKRSISLKIKKEDSESAIKLAEKLIKLLDIDKGK